MNLLTEPWIPVRCASGKSRMISPLELADPEDPPLELAAVRPDFNGALAQFLVGLMQWLAPVSESEWREIAEGRRVPELERLREIALCFEFDTGSRRFLQDMDFEPAGAGDLAALLLEAPGGNAIKNNTDLFIKRSDGMALSLPLAAQALLALQINAPAGGQGHRTSLRGGGPVSMLLWPTELDGEPLLLWRKVWFNTLVLDGDEPRNEIVFPWMAECLTSENDRDVRTLLASRSPSELELGLLCFFSTPRRARLHFADGATCLLSGTTGRCATAYETRNFGANYRSDLFRHPLSPYYRDKQGNFLPVHVGENGFTYADWIALHDERDDFRTPLVLKGTRFGVALSRQIPADAVWAFGFAMDNMKCLAWHEARFPRLALDETRRAGVLEEARRWLAGTDLVRRALGQQLRAAWSDQGKGDTSVAERELYALTERQFYALVNERAELLEVEDAALDRIHQDLRRRWQRRLAITALRLFQEHAERGDVASESLQAIARAAFAHRALRKTVYDELERVLDLDMAEHVARNAKSKGRKSA